MAFFNGSKKLLSLAQAEGKIVKLGKLIEIDRESLSRPDGFMNRHVKINTRLDKYYAELKEAEESFQKLVTKK